LTETSKNQKQAQSRSKLGLQRAYDSDSSQQDLKRKKHQRAYGLDFQKLLGKTSIELHWPGYQYLGAGTHLKKRLKRGDPGINRLDKLAKQHDIDYGRAKNLAKKRKTDQKMIKAIENLPGSKTMTERIVKRMLQAKKTLKF